MSSTRAEGALSIASYRVNQALKEQKALLVAMITCIVILPVSIIGPADSILYIALLLFALLTIVVSSVANEEKIDAGILVLFFAMICYLVNCWIINGGNAISRFIQYALMVLVMVAVSRYRWRVSDIAMLNKVFVLLMVVSALYWFVSGRPANYYSSIYSHSNGFANVIICAIVVKTMDVMVRERKGLRARDLIYIVLCLALLAMANSRSAMFAIIAAGLALVVIRRAGSRGNAARVAAILFTTVVAAMLIFSLVYPSLYGTQLGFQLETLSREYLNKNFFSGREVVWSAVLSAIEGHELFGLGLSMEPSMIYSTSISSHNLYLQTILQSGIIGLALVLGLLLLVVLTLSKGRSPVCRLGIALILGLLVHEGFEVTLTQNNFAYGVAYWALLGICLSFRNRESGMDAPSPNITGTPLSHFEIANKAK